MLKFISPKRREGVTDEIIAAMKARGFDIYVYRNNKDIFINSNDWDEDKENRLYEEYGLRTFREQIGDCNLVIYDPKFFKVIENLWLDEEILVYRGPDTGEVEFLTNCSSMKAMFQSLSRCEVDFSECDLSNISCIVQAFAMSGISKLSFGKQNLYKINVFDNVFSDCVNLEVVDFRGVQLPNVISISQCFLRCRSLISVNIGEISMPKLHNISHCFCKCEKLMILDCPNWYCTITQASFTFNNCYKLESVDTPNVVFDGDKFFNHMFSNSTNFMNFKFKEFKFNQSIDENTNESMFLDCTKLRDKSGCILANEILDYFKTRNNSSGELRNLESFN